MKLAKLKKLLSVSLAAFMVTATVSGCSGNVNGNTTSSKSSSVDVKEIVVTYLTTGNTPKDLSVVQDAVNKVTTKDIGVKVKFYPISAYDTASKYGVLFASGEQVDLAMVMLTPVQTYVSNGSLKPLDSIIRSDGKNLAALDKQYNNLVKVNDKVFAVGPVGLAGSQGSYLMKQDVFKKAGLTVKSGNYSYDDLTQVFAAVKKSNPKIYPCGLTGPNSKAAYTPFAYFQTLDNAGGYDSGVLMGTQSTKLVDMYESPEYLDFLKHAQKWYSAGYILPDAATNQTPLDSLVISGSIAGYPMAYSTTIIGTCGMAWGGVTCLPTTDKYVNSSSSPNGGWVVPISSKEPEAAIKFLDYLYTHDDLANLIQWGINGKHYKLVDKENGVISFADGVNPKNSGYYNTLGLWGNQNNVYGWSEIATKKNNNAFNNECFKNPTKALGFKYNIGQDLANTQVAVDSVIQQYVSVLETGSEKNLQATYTEFITKLKAAGIEKLIADKQAKFDAWYSKK